MIIGCDSGETIVRDPSTRTMVSLPNMRAAIVWTPLPELTCHVPVYNWLEKTVDFVLHRGDTNQASSVFEKFFWK